jgi:broad specificity phosphatase PhoE
MLGAMADARDDVRALGDPNRSEAVLVSHQLPVWIVRSAVEGKKLWHDPRRRQCTLASVTSFTYDDADVIVAVTYTEPAKALLPVDVGGVPKFSAGA